MKRRIGTIVFAGILCISLLMVYHQYRVDQSDIIYEDENGVTIRKVEDDTVSEDGDKETYDITKAYYEEYDDSGLETYIITSIFNEPVTYVQELRELDYCEYVFENNDEKIEIKLTSEQRIAWIARVEEIINDKLEKIEEEGEHKIVLSEDCRILNAEIEKTGNINEFAQDMILLTYNAEVYQILNGQEDWSINIIVKNANTGYELTNVVFPQEKFEITPEMWDE